ncbi:hypothetical protein [Nocardia wallacei]|uniref:hypothetical protein n=1 Tax=Nocardia wallacei TaxID=480035 RepID=UPI0024579F25|nr:hypothetical protein [Nocardia wallacei]
MSFPSVRVGGVERGPFAVLTVGGGPVLAGMSAHTPWWVLGVVVCVLVAAVTVRFGHRTAVRWLLDWMAFRVGRVTRARERSRPSLPTTTPGPRRKPNPRPGIEPARASRPTTTHAPAHRRPAA